jgi:hypothetical protein
MLKLKIRNLWNITIVGVFLILILLFWIFVIGISSNQPGHAFNSGHNAVWLGHKWVGELKTKSEIQDLVNTLKKHDIDTVFLHSGPLEIDGTVDPDTYKYALAFLENAKLFSDDIQYQAWLGQLRSEIDLSDSDVRKNIADQSFIMTEILGFDGIHFDIEPVWDEDMDFIKVLEETDSKISSDKKISVALAEYIPSSVIWFAGGIHEFNNYNSEVNFTNVAKYADQIAVMVYDTSIDRDWLYRWLVKEQTIQTTHLLKNTELFIGIPAYEDVKDSFNPEVENIGNALSGVIAGLNNIRSNEDSFAGVAIYSYWEISEDEWNTYDELWLK